MWGSGAVGLLGIPLVILVPEAALFTALVLLTILLHGPISFVFQGSFEPVLLWYGAEYPPLLVAAVATVSNLYIECVNYALFRAGRRSSVVQRMVAVGATARALAWIERSRVWAWCRERPFWMVLLCTATPIPDVAGRVAAVARDYPVCPYLAAHSLGRFPRFWLWAWLGSFLSVDRRYFELAAVLSVALGLTIVGIAGLRARYRRHRSDRQGPGGQQPPLAA